MQIPNLISSLMGQLICVSVCLFILCFGFVKLIAFLTTSHLLGIAIIIYGFYRLLRQVGMFALYPGCFNFIKSDYQIRGSQRLVQIGIRSMQELIALFQRCQQYPDTAYLVPCYFVAYVADMIRMLARFQGGLSQKKVQLLRIYREIDDALKKEGKNIDDLHITCSQLIQNPQQTLQKILQKHSNPSPLSLYSSQFRQTLTPLLQTLSQCLHQFHPPQSTNTLQLLLYKLYSQKLYQIRFCYKDWQTRFDFTVHLVPTQAKEVIQCAVVGPKAGRKDLGKEVGNFCVVFCCPNGAYLQYLALESQYMDMYFQLGFKVVLWNYRGYGQSTGTPSISNSISDAQSIYNYCKSHLNLTPVISHGYSIGGPPAAVLALSNPSIKTVIIDRSFCNFVNIAYEISPILAKLAKIVMKSDSSVNISEVFLKIRNCRKVMIWSAVDQVISHGCSLKIGVLDRLGEGVGLRDEIGVTANSPTSLISDNQLHQREVFIQKNSPGKNPNPKQNKTRLKTWVKTFSNFFQTITALYQLQKPQSSSQSPSTTLIEQLPIQLSQPQTQRRQLTKQLLNKFWGIVEHIDGGGTTMQFLQELATGGVDKSQELQLEVRSFVLGLVYFGCCCLGRRGQGEGQGDGDENWTETFGLLGKVEKELGEFIDQNGGEGAVRLIGYFKQVHRTFKQIRGYLQSINKNKDLSLGIILPTDSGHNGELSKQQLQHLTKLLSSTPTQTQAASSQKNRDILIQR